MTRRKKIDYIIKWSGDEFETEQDYVKLAKLSDYQLNKTIIKINNYLIQNK